MQLFGSTCQLVLIMLMMAMAMIPTMVIMFKSGWDALLAQLETKSHSVICYRLIILNYIFSKKRLASLLFGKLRADVIILRRGS